MKPLLALSVLLVMAATAPAANAEPSDPVTIESGLQCRNWASIYTVHGNDELWFRRHTGPATGDPGWFPEQRIGGGSPPALLRHTGGPNGLIYVTDNWGQLRRERWNGTGWDTFPSGERLETIDTNPLWRQYTDTTEYRNRITVDTLGHIYTVEPDGNLHWRSFDPSTRILTHRIVDHGWGAYNLIAAAGRGVLYARDSAGALTRFRYHAASQRILLREAAGTGWQVYSRIFSPGGDILYGVKGNGDLLWHSYDDTNRTWSASRVIATGWGSQRDVTAESDACERYYDWWLPDPPSISPRPNAPVALFRSSNDHVHYSYVDSENRAAYVEISDLTGGRPAGVAVVPGLTNLTGTTAVAENENGHVQLLGHGLDSEVHSNTQTVVGGPWGEATTLGGRFIGPATLTRVAGSTLHSFGVANDGGVWWRAQLSANGPMTAWRKISGNTGLDRSPLTAIPMGPNTVRLLGYSGNTTWSTTINLADGSNNGWRSLGSVDGASAGKASTVLMPDNRLHAFATRWDGVVYQQRETATGFPGTWTAIPGVAASGPPSAILAPDGMIKIVVRATDGFIYYTSETAPGSATFTSWQEITNYTDESATDPIALAVPGSNTWVVAYRTDLDVPRLRRYQPSALAAASESFVDIPLTPPA